MVRRQSLVYEISSHFNSYYSVARAWFITSHWCVHNTGTYGARYRCHAALDLGKHQTQKKLWFVLAVVVLCEGPTVAGASRTGTGSSLSMGPLSMGPPSGACTYHHMQIAQIPSSGWSCESAKTLQLVSAPARARAGRCRVLIPACECA